VLLRRVCARYLFDIEIISRLEIDGAVLGAPDANVDPVEASQEAAEVRINHHFRFRNLLN